MILCAKTTVDQDTQILEAPKETQAGVLQAGGYPGLATRTLQVRIQLLFAVCSN